MKSKMNIYQIMYNGKHVPMLAFFLIIVTYHFMANINYGDDITFFSKVLANTQNYISDTIIFSVDRYYSWSGRTIIEIFIIYLSHWPTIVWRLLDSLVWLLLFLSLCSLLDIRNNKMKWCLVVLLLWFPFKYTGTAGWICTSLNYTWTTSFGCYFLSIINKIYKNVVIDKWQKILALFALCYAANEEQMMVILLPITTYFMWKMSCKKQKSIMIISSWIIIFCEMIYSITCPGNESRLLIEVNNRMPDFLEYSLLEKLDMGYVNLINRYFQNFNILSVALCFVIYRVYIHLYGMKFAYLAVVPLIWSIACQIVAKSNIFDLMMEMRAYADFGISAFLQHALPLVMIVLMLYFLFRVLSYDNCKNKVNFGGGPVF